MKWKQKGPSGRGGGKGGGLSTDTELKKFDFSSRGQKSQERKVDVNGGHQ